MCDRQSFAKIRDAIKAVMTAAPTAVTTNTNMVTVIVSP